MFITLTSTISIPSTFILDEMSVLQLSNKNAILFHKLEHIPIILFVLLYFSFVNMTRDPTIYSLYLML